MVMSSRDQDAGLLEKELLNCAKQAREACAAAFRVAHKTNTWYQLEAELEKSGVKKAFGGWK